MPDHVQHWEGDYVLDIEPGQSPGPFSQVSRRSGNAFTTSLNGDFVVRTNGVERGRVKSDGTTTGVFAGSGGGGTGAVTIADGADTAEGTTTDAAYTSGSGTVVSLLKGIFGKLAGTLNVGGTVSVSNLPATQPISGTVTSNQGTAGATAWKVDGSGVTQPVSGTFWQATQPVSGTVTVQQSTAGNLKVDLSGTAANATALKVDGSAVTQPVSGTITANQGGAPWSDNLTQVGGVAVAATAKGTQATNFLGTQDAKDTGRTAVVLYLDAVTGITSEALATMSITKNGVAQTAATSYTVTAGKTFRISGIHTTVKNTSTVASDSRVRVRQAASSISVTSPIILLNEAGSPAAIANSAGTDDTVIPDGYEVAGGQQLAISHVESATTCTISVTVIGYEY